MRDPFEHADLGAAAAVRAEWRADEEEWTQAAIERWQHDRTVHDLMLECMHRGDTLLVELPHATLTGVLRGVGDDFVALDSPGGRVDVPVDARAVVFRVAEPARAGGTRGAAVTTFRMRLYELEADAGTVEVGTASSAVTLTGRLQVGRDHVVVRERDGGYSVVALGTVAWIRGPLVDDD